MDELIDGIGLIVEEVCKNLAFSYLFDWFFISKSLKNFYYYVKKYTYATSWNK